MPRNNIYTNLAQRKLRCKGYRSGLTAKGKNWQFCIYNLSNYNKSIKKFDYQTFKFVILNEQLLSPQNPDNFYIYINNIIDASYERNYYRDNYGNLRDNLTFVLYVYVRAKGLNVSSKDLKSLERINNKNKKPVDFDEENENQQNGGFDFDSGADSLDFMVDDQELPF